MRQKPNERKIIHSLMNDDSSDGLSNHNDSPRLIWDRRIGWVYKPKGSQEPDKERDEDQSLVSPKEGGNKIDDPIRGGEIVPFEAVPSK